MRQLFCDETGEALNEAAKRLVLDALAADKLTLEANGGAAPKLGPILSSIPAVECAQGTHKYVQVQLTHPDETGALLVVRSYDNCRFHAENYRQLMRDLSRSAATAKVVGRVIGGGRIRFEEGMAEVYGYSKTFGRTPGCNEKTAEIIRANCPGLTLLEWSDKGY